ncbi:MAG: ATP-binding protein [Rhodocyclaceae bacterium]|nr:ATP-binding protein [Rhodocyclaceae bacterium]MDZ4214849.1 ATP-binding protein [Rhodocyclaceae bacterium]
MQRMSAIRPTLDSLRHKIVFGYGAIAALVIGLSVFSLVDMRLMEERILAGERISQFLGITLEIRRFEKNYFLYTQLPDLDENRAYVAQARQLLAAHGELFAGFDTPERIATIAQRLASYDAMMIALTAPGDHTREEAIIRQTGKEIVTAAEAWSKAERSLLQAQLDRHRLWLVGSIAIVVALLFVIGSWLARRVARPLQQMEQSMAAVAAGQMNKLALSAPDREIVSLTNAFNHVLHELELRQGQLVRAEKLAALGTLLSGVAHELNNPLSNISTSCEILREEVGDGKTAFEQEMLEQIDSETWRARRIVRSLLDYARDREFRRENIALAALVEESLRLIKAQIPAQIELQIDIPESLTVSGDKQRLQQALFNLIGNALDALEGAGTLTIAARTAAPLPPAAALMFGQCPEQVLEIEIRDNGHGIPADVLPRIFDPFFTTKEVGQGLGLGLFIVFEIVEEHGGCIAVRSAPGTGTTFFLRLPAKEPHE